MKHLKTNIDKAQVTSLCADAISELERAVRLFPTWPEELYPIAYGPREVAAQLERARHHNETEGMATGHSIFGEEYMEFLEASFKPGNIVAARRELVQAMAMLLRIGCHLEDYVAKADLSAAQELRVNPEEAASQEGAPSELNRHEVRPRLGFEKGMDKKCVNGNCSIKAICKRYHQAANTFEAGGAGGLYDRHSCRKGKCDHYLAREVQP